MKSTIPQIILSLCLTLPLTAEVKKWTSADGIKSFRGEYLSAEDGKVTIKKGSKKLTFPIDQLHAGDQAWIENKMKEEAERQALIKKAKEEEKIKTAPITMELRGKVAKYDGYRFAKVDWQEIPKYYLLYFAGSQSEESKASTPALIKYYNENIIDNKDLELVWVPQDPSEADMDEWAMSQSFPWLGIRYSKVEDCILISARKGTKLPHYVLIDCFDKKLAHGFDSCVKKIEELSTTQ